MMPQPEVHLQPRQAVWLALMLVFAVTAVMQLRLAAEMHTSWGLWVAGWLALAAAGCGIAIRQQP